MVLLRHLQQQSAWPHLGSGYVTTLTSAKHKARLHTHTQKESATELCVGRTIFSHDNSSLHSSTQPQTDTNPPKTVCGCCQCGEIMIIKKLFFKPNSKQMKNTITHVILSPQRIDWSMYN